LPQMGQLCSACDGRAIPYLSEGLGSVTGKDSGRTAIMGFFS
jgi:hypothetical protein